MLPTLRNWNATHIEENCESLQGLHDNELFWNCTLNNLKGVTLKNCVLKGSQVTTKDLKDALGFTLTVGDCGSFRDVKYSEELFDLFLVLMITTSGNTEKRRKLLDVVGKPKVAEILHTLATLER